MPLFEFRCSDCGGLTTVLLYSWSSGNPPRCCRCGGDQLTRLISRFTLHKSWGEGLNWTPSGETMSDVDEDDPQNLDQYMGRIKDEMGGQVTSDFEHMRRELLDGPPYA